MVEQLSCGGKRSAVEPQSCGRPREYRLGQRFQFGATGVEIIEELPHGALRMVVGKTILARRSYRVKVTEDGKTHETEYSGALLDFAIDNEIKTT